jgi:DICT domain-containing protein
LQRFVADEAARRGIAVRTLGRTDDVLDPAQAGAFDASVQAMQYWCRLNERLVLERHAEGARLFVGVERFSRLRPVATRYGKLARNVQKLTLFGEADALVPFDAHAIDVTGGALAREWFLLVDAPQYKTLLVARDQVGFGPTGPLAGRRFVGMSTHDAQLVGAAVERLERLSA